jgi:endonuclease/exonuclease/phosphatase family metal-dependent hydrolase
MPRSFFRIVTKKFFIITNIVLAILFLLGCYGGHLNPLHFWPLGFLTLAAFYLFIGLLIFIVFWLFAKPWYILISAITILWASPALIQILPLGFGSSFTQQKQDNALRVMTWNVEHFNILEHKTHPEYKQRMLQLIKDYAPDIACFQELVGSDSVPRAINYIPDIMQELAFKDYIYSFNKKLDFDVHHHFGIAIFSKYPIINKKTVSFYPYDYNGTFQYADIVKGADTVRVFNLHLQSLKFSADNLRYIDNPLIKDENDLRKSKNLVIKFKKGFLKRREQADRIKAEIDISPYPVIVCGDFNDVPNSYAYNTIGEGLQNVFVEKGSGLGRTYSGISPTLRIDNIFAAEQFTIQQYTRVAKKMSDHFPLITDLELKK